MDAYVEGIRVGVVRFAHLALCECSLALAKNEAVGTIVLKAQRIELNYRQPPVGCR